MMAVAHTPKKIWIVVPCFYDFQSFIKLAANITDVFHALPTHHPFTLVLIDDSAGQDLTLETSKILSDCMVITPPYNLGHQGALVFALRKLACHIDVNDYVVTMDCDGEDQPDHILNLLEPLMTDSDDLYKISIAQRTRRNASIVIKTLYYLFKIFFRVLTGKIIQNGNFAAYRGWFLTRMIFHPYFDYCYSSSFIALPLQRQMVPLAKGERYFGSSKMNLERLLRHAIRMLLPFSETIVIRGLVCSSGLFLSGLAFGLITFFQSGGDRFNTISFLTCLFSIVIAAICLVFFAGFNYSFAHTFRQHEELLCKREDALNSFDSMKHAK